MGCMEKVIVSEYVLSRLNAISKILIYEGYFSYEENAISYVDEIADFINSIPKQKLRNCQNPEHGSYYCKFTPNKNTTWYITFDREADTYLIKNIFNNHTSDYPEFIKSIS